MIKSATENLRFTGITSREPCRVLKNSPLLCGYFALQLLHIEWKLEGPHHLWLPGIFTTISPLLLPPGIKYVHSCFMGLFACSRLPKFPLFPFFLKLGKYYSTELPPFPTWDGTKVLLKAGGGGGGGEVSFRLWKGHVGTN